MEPTPTKPKSLRSSSKSWTTTPTAGSAALSWPPCRSLFSEMGSRGSADGGGFLLVGQRENQRENNGICWKGLYQKETISFVCRGLEGRGLGNSNSEHLLRKLWSPAVCPTEGGLNFGVGWSTACLSKPTRAQPCQLGFGKGAGRTPLLRLCWGEAKRRNDQIWWLGVALVKLNKGAHPCWCPFYNCWCPIGVPEINKCV